MIVPLTFGQSVAQFMSCTQVMFFSKVRPTTRCWRCSRKPEALCLKKCLRRVNLLPNILHPISILFSCTLLTRQPNRWVLHEHLPFLLKKKWHHRLSFFFFFYNSLLIQPLLKEIVITAATRNLKQELLDVAETNPGQVLPLCDLLEQCLSLDPKKRLSVADALRHPFFSQWWCDDDLLQHTVCLYIFSFGDTTRRPLRFLDKSKLFFLDWATCARTHTHRKEREEASCRARPFQMCKRSALSVWWSLIGHLLFATVAVIMYAHTHKHLCHFLSATMMIDPSASARERTKNNLRCLEHTPPKASHTSSSPFGSVLEGRAPKKISSFFFFELQFFSPYPASSSSEFSKIQ